MFVATGGPALIHAEDYESGPAECPECGEPVYHRCGPKVAPHFSHYPDDSSGCSHESELHVKMKWQAAHRAVERWDADVHVDDRMVGGFRPDVVVEGIACIEVVVTNEGDRPAKADAYRDAGYRTLYIYSREAVDDMDWFTPWAAIGHAEWC